LRVIGTAGHVDHGKSKLVEALTGIDPDRLPGRAGVWGLRRELSQAVPLLFSSF